MSDLRKAAQRALEAMDDLHRTGDTQVFDLCHRETTEDLRAALAKCEYPDCVDNGPDGKCTRWLMAECEKSEDYRGKR